MTANEIIENNSTTILRVTLIASSGDNITSTLPFKYINSNLTSTLDELKTLDAITTKIYLKQQIQHLLQQIM